jgi:hypothetical protein
MIRLAQLIILDNKYPEWRDREEGFPPDELLEKHMPYNKLYKHADLAEMQTLFDVYDQMNKPEMPRKNFQRLGVILGESSPSLDSGAESSRFSAGSRTGG